jgi:hypothetical protein
MGEAAYTQWAFDQAVHFMAENPGLTARRMTQRFYVFWFTDIFDHWSWSPHDKWWNTGKRRLLKALITKTSALLPLVTVLVGIVSGRLRDLPYKHLFISVFVFLSIPYCITHAGDVFSQAVRPWLAVLALIVLMRVARPNDKSLMMSGGS